MDLKVLPAVKNRTLKAYLTDLKNIISSVLEGGIAGPYVWGSTKLGEGLRSTLGRLAGRFWRIAGGKRRPRARVEWIAGRIFPKLYREWLGFIHLDQHIPVRIQMEALLTP